MSDDESPNDIGTQATRNIVQEMVKCILMFDHSKKPIKQTEIMSLISNKPGRKALKNVWSETKNSLLKMGYDLVETDHSSTRSFILVSTCCPAPNLHKYASTEEKADRTLLIIVLAFLFMKEGPASEIEILNHLGSLGIWHNDQTDHVYFGPLKKKLFTQYVDQLYLTSRKKPGSDSNEITWGERAECEVSKRAILEFVCQVGYNDRIKPESFVSQYQKVKEETEDNEEGEANPSQHNSI